MAYLAICYAFAHIDDGVPQGVGRPLLLAQEVEGQAQRGLAAYSGKPRYLGDAVFKQCGFKFLSHMNVSIPCRVEKSCKVTGFVGIFGGRC